MLRFGVDRTRCRGGLRMALRDFKVSLLTCCLTGNHTHLLVPAGTADSVSRKMQKLKGESAEWCNRRKGRSGAFREDRCRCTLVDGRKYALNCIR